MIFTIAGLLSLWKRRQDHTWLPDWPAALRLFGLKEGQDRNGVPAGWVGWIDYTNHD